MQAVTIEVKRLMWQQRLLSLHLKFLLGHSRVGKNVAILSPLWWNVELVSEKALSIALAIVDLEASYVEDGGFVSVFVERCFIFWSIVDGSGVLSALSSL